MIISSTFIHAFFVQNFDAKAETLLEKAAKKGVRTKKARKKTLMKLTARFLFLAWSKDDEDEDEDEIKRPFKSPYAIWVDYTEYSTWCQFYQHFTTCNFVVQKCFA